MSITKPERHANELAIFNQRHEGGVRATYDWLCARRDEINRQWVGMEGADLMKAQGEASLVARMIRMIEQGPSIKPIEGKQNG